MSLFINTNIASLYAQNNVANSQNALATSIQRLSSGLRINSAKDDAAGMAIAARMTSQIGGLTQAAQNANDGISMAQTAEGALAQVINDLQTMRNLAVQAANGTNSASDRASLQSNIAQLQQDISQISTSTQFNGLNLLDGSLSNVQFQTGANAGQVINASIGSASAHAIGDNTASSSTGASATSMDAATASAAAIGLNNFAAQSLAISVGGQNLTIPATGTFATGTTAYAIANQVNSIATSSGAPIQAVAHSYAKLSAFSAGAVSLTLQGAPDASGNANPVTVSATLSTATDTSSLAAAINAVSAKTGITAVADTVAGTIALTQNQGYDIGVKENAASAGGFQLTGTNAAGAAIGAAVQLNPTNVTTATAAVATGSAIGAGGNLTSSVTIGATDTLSVMVNGTAVNATLTTGTYTTIAALAGAISIAGATVAATATGLTVTNTATGYTSTLGTFTGTLATATGLGSATVVQGKSVGNVASTVGGQVDFHSSSSFSVTSSTGTTFLASVGAGTSGLSAVDSIDVTTVTNGVPTGANTAMFIVDGAINTINGLRAQLGALQNRFVNAQNSLTTTSTNMQQARSRIQDTDYASETANLTHNQILQQAGTAMLAQANALPNSVLTLLK